MSFQIRCPHGYIEIRIRKKEKSKKNGRKERILSFETIGKNGGDGSSSEEDGGGKFHLNHDDSNIQNGSAIDARKM